MGFTGTRALGWTRSCCRRVVLLAGLVCGGLLLHLVSSKAAAQMNTGTIWGRLLTRQEPRTPKSRYVPGTSISQNTATHRQQ